MLNSPSDDCQPFPDLPSSLPDRQETANPTANLPRTFSQDSSRRPSVSDNVNHSKRSSVSLNSDLELDYMDRQGMHFQDEEGAYNSHSKLLQPQRNGLLQNGDLTDSGDLLRNLGDRNFVRNVVINTVLIGLWYIFSVSISVVCSTDCLGSKP